MELRHLRYFSEAARELHVGRAAETLSIAQPALTLQIQALERELGVELFDRAGRRIALTEAGKHFLMEATEILAQVERATLATREIGGGFAGKLRVGFTESASFSPMVMSVLTRFRSTWPAVDLVLEESQTDSLVTGMIQGRIDVAFVRPPVRGDAKVAFKPLADEEMKLAVPVGHRLAKRKAIDLSELRDEAFVVYPRKHGTGLSDGVIAECRRAGFVPRIVQETPQLSATINLVAAGMGVAIVPACMSEVRKDSVVFITVRGLEIKAHLALIMRERDRSRAVGNFISIALS